MFMHSFKKSTEIRKKEHMNNEIDAHLPEHDDDDEFVCLLLILSFL